MENVWRGANEIFEIMFDKRWNMKKTTKIGSARNTLSTSRNYLMNVSNKLIRISSNFLRKVNNKLNIYSELKRKYKFSNNMEEHFSCIIIAKNGIHYSIVKLLIVSNQNDNQQNYFNC